MDRPLRISFAVGEASGDELGADLMAALKARHSGTIEFSGLGGKAMGEAGLNPLFDIEEIAVMGISAVVGRLLAILKRINQTAQAIIDCLLYTSPSPRDLSTSRMPSSA